MKVIKDDKAKTITITMSYDEKGRIGKGAIWTKIHATETANLEIDNETKRVQVTVMGK